MAPAHEHGDGHLGQGVHDGGRLARGQLEAAQVHLEVTQPLTGGCSSLTEFNQRVSTIINYDIYISNSLSYYQNFKLF